MNASLPTLPVLVPGIEAATLPNGDVSLNQQVGSSSDGFGLLLQQAVGALGEPPVVSADGAESLSRQLQGLPQGGKLLPLLQQVLDAAAAEGTEAGAVFEDIAAKLRQLSTETDLDPGQAVATAIQQYIDDNPRLAVSLDTDLLRGLSGRNTLTPVREPGTRLSTLQQAPELPAATTRTNAGAAMPEVAADPGQRTLTGLDKLAGELLPITPDQRDGAPGDAVSLFRHLASGTKTADPADGLVRSDSVLTALSSATAPTAAQSAPALSSVSLNVPFNQAGWDEALGERIQWMVGQGMQRASIKLNPAHLGPMEVRIQVQNDQASVQFTSAHGVVREALEAALPRLRDMFDNAGVELTDVDVSGQSFAEQQPATSDGRGSAGGSGRNAVFDAAGEADITLETPVYSLPESGRLDLFA